MCTDVRVAPLLDGGDLESTVFVFLEETLDMGISKYRAALAGCYLYLLGLYGQVGSRL